MNIKSGVVDLNKFKQMIKEKNDNELKFIEACKADKINDIKEMLDNKNIQSFLLDQKDMVTWCSNWNAFKVMKFLLGKGQRVGRDHRWNAYSIAIQKYIHGRTSAKKIICFLEKKYLAQLSSLNILLN